FLYSFLVHATLRFFSFVSSYTFSNVASLLFSIVFLLLFMYVLWFDCTIRIFTFRFATISRYCHCAFMYCGTIVRRGLFQNSSPPYQVTAVVHLCTAVRLYVEDNSRTLRHRMRLLQWCIDVLRFACHMRII